MAYKDIPQEVLDWWWCENNAILATNPSDWHAIRQKILLENEYDRRGWTLPLSAATQADQKPE
jgi:hypothetical protein